MPVELKIPSVGESITEVEIGNWLKAEGDMIAKDESLVTIESEKASMDLPSPISGRLSQILKNPGDAAAVGEVIARLEESNDSPPSSSSANSAPAIQEPSLPEMAAAPAKEPRVMPAAQRLLDQHNLPARSVQASGPGGRMLKEDVLHHMASSPTPDAVPVPPSSLPSQEFRQEEIVPMNLLRRTIAARLVEAQQQAALLTTFNEIDMSAVQDLRLQHQESFQKRYQIKLGFSSFFVKACVDALKLVPQLNAEIRGKNIVYRNYHDIGVAIGGGKGLVVPVLRNADQLSFAQIETAIHSLAQRARENRLHPEELQGGTFTISNGGVYGSLLSTPIVNPPQSGVLGLHSIQDRPVAAQGQVVIRPMMYVALTYDHRIVDGREAVMFLKRIKETIESPARMLLEV